jgi:cytochrome d ubiquinol oxidase subunit II
VRTTAAAYGTFSRVGREKYEQRQFIAHAIGPIWEADHVWLILIIVIMFSGFPAAFSMVMTDLNIPLTLMLVGIVLRGAAFSFRSYGSSDALTDRRWSRIFGRASLVTPALLGITIGAIASGRLPESPHQLSGFVRPWVTPFCASVGLFAVTMFAYLSATYAAYEAEDPKLREDFRSHAIASAISTGVMAGVVLLLSAHGAPIIWRGLTNRIWTWPLFWMTAILALTALYALWRSQYRLARFCAAGEVTLILWGWAFAQFPYVVVPNLTIYNSSSSPATIYMLAGALMAGSLVLFPSYKYLLEIFKSNDPFLGNRSFHKSKDSTV